MLEHSGSRMPGEEELVENITVNCSSGSHLSDNKVTLQECGNISKVLFDFKSEEHPIIPLTENRKQAKRKVSDIYCLQGQVSPWLQEGKRRYGVMTLAGQSQSSDSLSRRIWFQSTKKNDQDQEGEEKVWCGRQGNAVGSISNLSPGRISGDSDLTAENMGEAGGSGTSRFDDACTLTLESGGMAPPKKPTTPERSQQRGTNLTFSLEGVSNRLTSQRESCTTDYRLNEKPFNFEPLVEGREHADQRDKSTLRRQIIDLQGVTATQPEGTNETKAEEDDNWLQLGIGRKQDGCDYLLSEFDSSSPDTERTFATLQLLPEPTRRREPCSTPRQSVAHLSSNEQQQANLIPFMTSTPTTMAGPGELAAKRMVEEPAYGGRSTQNPEQIHSLITNYLLPARDLPAPSRLQSVSRFGDVLQLRNEIYTDLSTEDEESARRMKVSTVTFPSYPHASDSRFCSLALTHNAVYDRLNNRGAYHVSTVPTTSKEISLNYMWDESALNENNERFWGSVRDQALDRTAWPGLESTLTAMEPSVEAVSHNLLSFQGGQAVAEEWQGIVKEFGTDLHCESNILLPKSERLSFLPAQDMATIEQTIDRLQSSRAYSSDKSNIISGSTPPWTSATLTGSFLRLNAPEPCRRMLSRRLEDGGMPAAAEILQPELLLPPNLNRIYSKDRSSENQPIFNVPQRMKLKRTSQCQGGIWFTLRAAENLCDDQVLPQIQKTYLRIKDGKMPISVLKKYIVAKLRLTSDSEVDITCRGQLMLPNLSLEYVRDVIWYSNDLFKTASFRFTSSNSASPTSNEHVMILMYQRHLESTPKKSFELH